MVAPDVSAVVSMVPEVSAGVSEVLVVVSMVPEVPVVVLEVPAVVSKVPAMVSKLPVVVPVVSMVSEVPAVVSMYRHSVGGADSGASDGGGGIGGGGGGGSIGVGCSGGGGGGGGRDGVGGGAAGGGCRGDDSDHGGGGGRAMDGGGGYRGGVGSVIHCLVRIRGSQRFFFLSVVYGDNRGTERKRLWSGLRKFKSILGDKPWTVMSDFNCLLFPHDALGGISRRNGDMEDFGLCLEDIELFVAHFTGIHYTWCQKPKAGAGLKR
ncbi:hypothetical protein OSB04_024567 [Centaurea solstitialis]|uniref:Uncharacterized protein n=1 Tax=Centaurea solstitialis TaxID=347529 RepID=A0AA38SLD0_9ASTR|nr:hypothetical protein OSB04_024567 [Centaurea solstitialis]